MSEPSLLWSPLYSMRALYVRSSKTSSSHMCNSIYNDQGRNVAFLSGEDEYLVWEIMFRSTVNAPEKVSLSSSCSTEVQSQPKGYPGKRRFQWLC